MVEDLEDEDKVEKDNNNNNNDNNVFFCISMFFCIFYAFYLRPLDSTSHSVSEYLAITPTFFEARNCRFFMAMTMMMIMMMKNMNMAITCRGI